MNGAYYNEIDPYAAAWLRNLIAAGHIAAGDVDERSIRDVDPVDLIGYAQCHFFAGIGVWSYALRRAGWDDARPVWTGSCPCQPFSAAGKRTGTADDRHLWPEFFRLIGAHSPHVVFGEQVASKDGLAWLDAVQADLEGTGYAFGALDLCAAGFGAPHIRQRLFFVAEPDQQQRDGSGNVGARGWQQPSDERSARGATGFVADTLPARRPEGWAFSGGGSPTSSRSDDLLEHPASEQVGLPGRPRQSGEAACELAHAGSEGSPEQRGRRLESEGLAPAGFWSDCAWLPCIDGKARPVEPGTFPLAHGAPARVGRLRAYGNAIVAPVAAEFIRAYIECRP